jgi:osmotically-inducible protein OsmY
MMKQFSVICVLMACAPFLSGCVWLGIGAVGTTAGVAATQEGGLSRAVSDAQIQVQINDLWLKYDFDMFSKLDMTINDGRVLLTGIVQNPDHRVEAVRLAWQPKGVKQVINEIRVAQSDGVMGFAKDNWITTRLRGTMVMNKQVQSVNYSIDTVQGTVYLMGYAQSQEELDRVVSLAQTIPDVKQVVSYVKVHTPLVEGQPSGY